MLDLMITYRCLTFWEIKCYSDMVSKIIVNVWVVLNIDNNNEIKY